MIYYTENQIDDLRTVIGAKDAEIARLRDALYAIDNRCQGLAPRIARAALAQVAEVTK